MVYWRISLLRLFNCDYNNVFNGDYTQVRGFRVREALSGWSGVWLWTVSETHKRAVRKERKNLQQMVEKHNSTKVHCLRNSEWIDVWSRDLVPGDVIHVPPGGCTLPADCCLLTGECIVDEGMLTGESIPVIKSPLKVGFSGRSLGPNGFEWSLEPW